ncbi:hypothetical protein BsIDN1_12110 [Bacillus safensis]|uniref:Amidophosphoribosyltransferase n=1 Tax=Bacillus safensis TaxID=561879 RepID=A0A5S9M377_BACIA|nr:hypothetical protein BsIDN1_12110 [Bacillus safensis]
MASLGFGDTKKPRKSHITGLHSLQHRGQEGAGIIATDGENLTAHKGLGLITEVFQNGELKKGSERQRSDRTRSVCDSRRRRL